MGGGSDKASKQAQADEAARQAQIKAATGQINAIFDNPSRTGQYDQLGADTTRYYTDELNRENTVAARNLKFAQARNGQVGSSVEADQGSTLGKDYLRGVVEATRRGAAASAGLRSQDEQSRANLIALAQSGLDTTTASQQATSALQSNLQSLKATSTANGLGDLFGNVADLYKRSQDAADTRRGLLYGYGGLFGGTAPTTPWGH